MKHKGRNIALIAIIIIIITFVVLWITGPLPSSVARASAQSYVDSRYASKDLKFSEVYWDSMWNRYFVSFTDETGSVYNFKMSELFPNTIMYDPINPPG
jgi:hypothetical protein